MFGDLIKLSQCAASLHMPRGYAALVTLGRSVKLAAMAPSVPATSWLRQAGKVMMVWLLGDSAKLGAAAMRQGPGRWLGGYQGFQVGRRRPPWPMLPSRPSDSGRSGARPAAPPAPCVGQAVASRPACGCIMGLQQQERQARKPIIFLRDKKFSTDEFPWTGRTLFVQQVYWK